MHRDVATRRELARDAAVTVAPSANDESMRAAANCTRGSGCDRAKRWGLPACVVECVGGAYDQAMKRIGR